MRNLLIPIGFLSKTYIFGLPWQDLYKDALLFAMVFITITCIIMVLTVFIIHHKTRRIAKQLIQLTETAKAIARGERTLPTVVTGPIELANLANAMNRMTLQFNQVMEELSFQKILLESQSEASIVGMLVVSPQGKIISYNQRFVEMWEIPKSVIEDKSDQAAVESILHKLAQPQEFLDKIQNLTLHLDEVCRNEICLNDGKVFDRFTAPIKNAAGTYYGRGWFYQDITDRKHAEKALRENEEKYRRLVEISPIAMWINQNNIITYMNPAALRLLRAESLQQVVGRAALDFIHSDYHAAVKERITEMVIHEHTVPLLEEKYIRLDGSLVDVEVIATPFPTPGGNAMQVLFQDITERKRAEAERLSLIAELENRNAELERFAYTVSHDLKAPLVTIRGFLGFVAKDAASGNMERLQTDMARITDATNRMQQLLTELLELSRIGRLINPSQDAPFETIVREAIELLHGRLAECGVQVVIAPNLPVVHGDRARLVEMVQNLMDNSAKFMGKQSEPCIEIGQDGEEDGTPIFYVKDNGIGIAPEYHDTVFGLFNKLDPQSEGTGIGLSLVKRIVEIHGGRIWVESDGKHHGTTFYFSLPTR